jgi:hypothetical protein
MTPTARVPKFEPPGKLLRAPKSGGRYDQVVAPARDDARSSDLIQRRGRVTSAYDQNEID